MKRKILISLALLAVSFGVCILIRLFILERLQLGNVHGFFGASFVGFVLTFFMTWACGSRIKSIRPGYTALLIWFGVSVLEGINLVQRLCERGSLENYEYDFPIVVLWTAGVLLGYLFCKLSNKTVIAALLVAIFGVVTWFMLRGYPAYTDYLTYESWTGELEEPVAVDFQLQTSEGQTIGLNDLPEEYLIFDFWSTYCVPCYEGFPAVQQLHDRFGKDAKVGVYGVHNRFESENEDVATGTKLLTEEGYTFPCLSAPRNQKDILRKALGIKSYPTVLIFDKERKMIYRGSVKKVEEFMEKRLSVGQ